MKAHKTITYEYKNAPIPGGGYVTGLLYHPKQPGILYARTDIGGVYRYEYEKKCWMDCQHFFRQIFLGYFSDIVQAFDTLRKNVCGDDYTSLHNPIVLSSVLPAYGMFHSIQILFL